MPEQLPAQAETHAHWRTAGSLLGPDGPLASWLGSKFEPRDEQGQMADAVYRAMETRAISCIEAGTGTGKSFAYLVPAILRCLHHGERCVIATNTIALQEQLAERDIPRLLGTLAEPTQNTHEITGENAGEKTDDSSDSFAWRGHIRAELVKGRNNYVSIRRLELASRRQEKLFPSSDIKLQLHRAEEWAYSTTDGSLSSWDAPPHPEIWDHIVSDRNNCKGKRCQHFDRCFYQSARRRAESANILVCNHALFFADLALRSQGVSFLPRYDHVVIDEAHMIEDVASDHLGLTISQGPVQHTLRTLYDIKRQSGLLDGLRTTDGETTLTDRVIRRVLETRSHAETFFAQWQRLLSSGELGNGRVRTPDTVPNTLSPALRELASALATLKDVCVTDDDKADLDAFARRIAGFASSCEVFSEQSQDGYAYWAELEGGTKGGRSSFARVKLCCSPVKLGPVLRERLFEQGWGVILTSATLTTRKPNRDVLPDEAVVDVDQDDSQQDQPETQTKKQAKKPSPAFAHLLDRLGCENATTLSLGSPFDFANQLRVRVDPAMPDPRASNYVPALASRIMNQAIAHNGGTMTLFTSFATLEGVAGALRDEAEIANIELLVHRPGASRTALLTQFREHDRALLLGAASFWQGVDIAGDDLRCVILTRLPFEPPNRPLTEARVEQIEADGGSGFRDDALPRAILRFRQGAGRLIRSHADIGTLVVLDSRIVRSSYGKLFRDALPAGARIEPIDAPDERPDDMC